MIPIIPAPNHFIGLEVENKDFKNEYGFITTSENIRKSVLTTVKVVSISECFENNNLHLKVGDIVILPKRGSTKVTSSDGNKYHLCHKNDIIGIN